MRLRLSLLLSASTIFGALASVFAVFRLSIPYPFIPYLKFDLAEIPILIALLGFGLFPGILSAAIYSAILLPLGEFSPIGPSMKFLAILSMILGVWFGFKTARSRGSMLILAFIFGSISRILAMSIANYLVAYILFPDFTRMASETISLLTNLRLSGEISALLIVLGFTAVFNLLHTILSLFPSFFLVRRLSAHKTAPLIENTWYESLLKEKEG